MVSAPRLTAILSGVTAAGKSAIALEVARRHGLEIINADSLLVYRGMDIGSAKPSTAERAAMKHHLIDIRDPNGRYDAGDFVREANAAIAEIETRQKRALIVGGTGFYLKALVFGMWKGPETDPALRTKFEAMTDQELYRALDACDPVSALRIGPNDRYRLVRAHEIIALCGRTPTELQADMPSRPDPRFQVFVLDREDADLTTRIRERTSQMLAGGIMEETERVRADYPDSPCLKAVGYAQVCDYLDGKAPAGRKIEPALAGLQSEIELATRQLVKKQRTWFRSFAAKASGIPIHLDSDRSRLEQALKAIYG